jgi:hypothetical protein
MTILSASRYRVRMWQIVASRTVGDSASIGNGLGEVIDTLLIGIKEIIRGLGLRTAPDFFPGNGQSGSNPFIATEKRRLSEMEFSICLYLA